MLQVHCHECPPRVLASGPCLNNLLYQRAQLKIEQGVGTGEGNQRRFGYQWAQFVELLKRELPIAIVVTIDQCILALGRVLLIADDVALHQWLETTISVATHT